VNYCQNDWCSSGSSSVPAYTDGKTSRGFAAPPPDAGQTLQLHYFYYDSTSDCLFFVGFITFWRLLQTSRFVNFRHLINSHIQAVLLQRRAESPIAGKTQLLALERTEANPANGARASPLALLPPVEGPFAIASC